MTMLRLRKGDEGPALPLTVVRKVRPVPNTAVSWPGMLPSPPMHFCPCWYSLTSKS